MLATAMPKTTRSDDEKEDTSVLFIRVVPRTLQAKMKAMAALNQQSLGQYVLDLFEKHLEESHQQPLFNQYSRQLLSVYW